MEFHPITDRFALMDDDELKSLAESISANGQRSPITVYQGKILDGRNRYRACQMIGSSPVLTEYTGDDPQGFAFDQNIERLHLKSADRKRIVLLLRSEGMSTRAIAKKLKVHHSTVQDDLRPSGGGFPPPDASAEPNGTSEPSAENVRGKDGKTYKAKAKAKSFGKTTRGRTRKLGKDAANGSAKLIADGLDALAKALDVEGGVRSVGAAIGDVDRWVLADRLETLGRTLLKQSVVLRSLPPKTA